MADTKSDRIVRSLLEKSRINQVAWNPSVTEDRYAVNLADSSIVIEHRPGLARLSVLNESGTEIDGTDWLAGSDADALRELFQLARKRALEVEKRLDEVLAAVTAEGELGGD